MVAAGNLRWAAPARRAAASDFVGTFEPYGQLRTHLAGYNDTAEVQDNATRVGINFRTRGAVKMFAGTEWGVNLVQSETQFNLSASGPGDFGVVETDTSQVFTARLGFIGVDFGPLGRVAIGKQKSVHYDVTSYTTDRFNVFGGQGTSTYVAGTDGGASGTGSCRSGRELPEHHFQDSRSRDSRVSSAAPTPTASAVRSSSQSCRE